MRVLRELLSGQRSSFAVSKRQESRDRVAIFALRRRSAKTWWNTSLSDSGGDGLMKSRAVCIGRPVVARLS
jgi:hypothetical protein